MPDTQNSPDSKARLLPAVVRRIGEVIEESQPIGGCDCWLSREEYTEAVRKIADCLLAGAAALVFDESGPPNLAPPIFAAMAGLKIDVMRLAKDILKGERIYEDLRVRSKDAGRQTGA